jgi:hypothetical protein
MGLVIGGLAEGDLRDPVVLDEGAVAEMPADRAQLGMILLEQGGFRKGLGEAPSARLVLRQCPQR